MRRFLSFGQAACRAIVRRHRRSTFAHNVLSENLESRWVMAAPAAPVIIEPFTEGQITGTFDINMQTDPAQYFDADGHAWQATDWRIREQAAAAQSSGRPVLCRRRR